VRSPSGFLERAVTVVRAPTGLAPGGRRLWRDVVAAYTLREDERIALSAACRTLDELGRLEAALRSAPTVIPGSKGQDRPNPLFAEVRAHRLTLRQLLIGVGMVDSEVSGFEGAARSAAGRKLARERWSRHGAA
jgi:hypothetical protein